MKKLIALLEVSKEAREQVRARKRHYELLSTLPAKVFAKGNKGIHKGPTGRGDITDHAKVAGIERYREYLKKKDK